MQRLWKRIAAECKSCVRRLGDQFIHSRQESTTFGNESFDSYGELTLVREKGRHRLSKRIAAEFIICVRGFGVSSHVRTTIRPLFETKH